MSVADSDQCPKGICDGTGWILGPDDRARACECRTARRTRHRAANLRSVIPPKFADVDFDRPPISEIDPKIVKPVRDYADSLEEKLSGGESIWLFGNVGSGKTTLGMAVTKRALLEGYAVAVYSLPALLDELRATYEAGSAVEHSRLMDQLVGVDLLHIDDLGAERATDWVLDRLYVLINERYERYGSLLVTSNQDPEELSERLTERVVSRLVEMTELYPLHSERDYRYDPRPWPQAAPDAASG